MKTPTRRTAIAITAVTAAALSAAAHAGVIVPNGGNVEYSLHSSAATAALGDTVTLEVHANVNPHGDPFVALGAAEFDIMIDDLVAGGTTDIASPGLGLAPDFLMGSPGAVVGSDVLGVAPAQLPQIINPAINTSTNLTLYTFEYTIDDATPRTITFEFANLSSTVYGDSTGSLNPGYSSTSSPTQVTVNSVPAPGALALLGAAGFASRRRRQR